MATSYTSLLRLAQPAQGELSGTWGTVVNDNITAMVEEAISGSVTLDTWVADSHTLTTVNGTTDESRPAMLFLTDTTVDLSGAGTLICPTATKAYIVKNDTGQTITVKTSAGTGIAVEDGNVGYVFCDGTNVENTLTAASLTVSGAVELATITETNVGTDTTRAVTPDGLDGWTGSAQVVTLGTVVSFTSTGIDDNATSTAITIGADEFVGITQTTPASPLQVSRTSTASWLALTNDSSGHLTANGLEIGTPATSTNVAWIWNYSNGGIQIATNALERMRIAADGDIYFGTTTAIATERYAFKSTGIVASFATTQPSSTTALINFYNASTFRCAYIKRDGVYVTVSDETVKENIVPSTRGLDDLMALQVREFDFIDGPHVEAGFIAQELREVLPDACADDGEGLLGRADQHIVPVLTKAIQEQQVIIESLIARLDALET